jgi:hypothetical protein
MGFPQLNHALVAMEDRISRDQLELLRQVEDHTIWTIFVSFLVMGLMIYFFVNLEGTLRRYFRNQAIMTQDGWDLLVRVARLQATPAAVTVPVPTVAVPVAAAATGVATSCSA